MALLRKATADAVVPEDDKRSFHFTGNIKRVTLEISGEPHQDDEAAA